MSPSGYLTQHIKQAGFSFTLGVFVGSAVTMGLAFGLLTAWVANEKVLRKIRTKALELVSAAHNSALKTQEGQALHRALLALGSSEAPARTEPFSARSTSSATSSFEQGSFEHVIVPSVMQNPKAALDSSLRPGECLPVVAPPGGHYAPFRVSNTHVYLSGYTSRTPDGVCIRGPCVDASLQSDLGLLGALDATAGAEAARTCALGHLAILEAHCGGLANVKRVVKVTCSVNIGPTPAMNVAAAMRHSTSMHSSVWFTQSPIVANGYSDLVTSVFGCAGEHARSAVCVAGLPDGAAVEVEAVVELHDPSRLLP